MQSKSNRLWARTYDYLLDLIRSMRPDGNRLPSEDELAQTLEVSRSTVREATQALTREGYLTRRHGKGNFAHPSVDSLRHRMDLTTDFLRLLDTGEGEVRCENLRSGYGPCREVMRRRFPLPCDTVYEQEWLYSTGGVPMIFCRSSLPPEFICTPPRPIEEENSTLIRWISDHCGRDFAYYAAHMCCRSDPDACWALRLPADTVVLNWQEVLYDLTDTPVAFCDIFFHPQNVDLSMVLRP